MIAGNNGRAKAMRRAALVRLMGSKAGVQINITIRKVTIKGNMSSSSNLIFLLAFLMSTRPTGIDYRARVRKSFRGGILADATPET
jgi:hypothetical protein